MNGIRRNVLLLTLLYALKGFRDFSGALNCRDFAVCIEKCHCKCHCKCHSKTDRMWNIGL